MSHELTVFEWVNRLTNEFNELRIAASDVIKMKAVEYLTEVGLFFSDASVFIVNHSSELLYGSLSVFMVVIFTILLSRALNAENKVHELDRLLSVNNQKLDLSEKIRDSWRKAWIELDAENDKLSDKVNELTTDIEDSQLAFEAMREEFSDKLAEMTSLRDEIQTEFDEMESDRDYWQEQSGNWEYDANLFGDERDAAQAELENLKSTVPQLAYAA